MSKYPSRNHAFQFGLLLFLVMSLSVGIILTTGKASLNLFSSAAPVGYDNLTCREDGNIWSCTGGPCKLVEECAHDCIQGANPAKCNTSAKPPVPPLPPPSKCVPDGSACVNGKDCCGFCNSGKCTSVLNPPSKCISAGSSCSKIGVKCCPGTSCSGLLGTCR